MGNSHSTSQKSATAGASSPTASQPLPPHLHHHSDSARGPRREARNIIPPHTPHRSAAPPEASLAQAHGSTVVSWPKSLPGTAVSSLSGSPHSNVSNAARAARDEPSKPVDVPADPATSRGPQSYHHHLLQTQHNTHDSPLVHNNSATDMYLRGPPRLPLPIEEEVHTPGSPILPPDQDFGDIDLGEASDGLTRKGSALSANTVDDEESEELRVDKTRPVVPTRLEWRRGGDKVYVTGTIFQWNRKQRLHPVDGKPGCFAATIHILPGTHHVRFLVDGIMQTSQDLPTTVDFGNNLVNYIEVNPDDVPAAQKPGGGGVSSGSASRTSSQAKEATRQARGRPVDAPESYRNEIPQYLLDFDQPEDSAAYRNAVAAIEKLPTPPSLPGFLGRPILNAATLMKDDNSVLNMPNHTVLNHLATSSIKNNVLAVSATTRYRNKYVTTIMYKPTSADEG
ncbi:hypothetical protein L249_4554 [Ophiocordyceps polyrhachis-furcata BCC 54312]|uniref:Association with the SNF1 complex (ASC) domain-containing protein n=1 Tax=Ophiocordyceps polyrhachis-furcata BCC 54312 TaxID=1330021 RepID=A0A367KZ88_9HYPO|nr:hypothetical protein L249_4554 [Ophiocordyceps polyrhachis-furcata BCC 54312]